MKLPKLTPGDPIQINWIDAYDPLGPHWTPVHKVKGRGKCEIRSVGYFFCATKRYLIIARDTAKRQRAGIFYIPIGCIESVRRLK